jgi:hypothetical protein
MGFNILFAAIWLFLNKNRVSKWKIPNLILEHGIDKHYHTGSRLFAVLFVCR